MTSSDDRDPTLADAASSLAAFAVSSPRDAARWLQACGVLEAAVQAGEMIPDFDLLGHEGDRVDLQGLLDRGPLAVTFVLGAASPRCRASLSALRDALPAIVAHRARLVAISPDPPSASADLARACRLDFPILGDDGHVARLFGLCYRPPDPVGEWLRILGVEVGAGSSVPKWLPIAATYVVDTAGIAVHAFIDSDPTARVAPAAVLEALCRLTPTP